MTRARMRIASGPTCVCAAETELRQLRRPCLAVSRRLSRKLFTRRAVAKSGITAPMTSCSAQPVWRSSWPPGASNAQAASSPIAGTIQPSIATARTAPRLRVLDPAHHQPGGADDRQQRRHEGQLQQHDRDDRQRAEGARHALEHAVLQRHAGESARAAAPPPAAPRSRPPPPPAGARRPRPCRRRGRSTPARGRS